MDNLKGNAERAVKMLNNPEPHGDGKPNEDGNLDAPGEAR